MGVSDVDPRGPTTAKTPAVTERTCGRVHQGNTRYLVVAVTQVASLLRPLGGGWFDGS